MAIITFAVIMCIIGYLLKDFLEVVLIGIFVFLIMQNGWDIVPMAMNHIVNFIDSVRGTL